MAKTLREVLAALRRRGALLLVPDLLARVEAEGRVLANPAEKKALERTALVRVWSEHGAGGRHVTYLERWPARARPADEHAVAALTLEEAHAQLAAAGIDLRPARARRRAAPRR